MFEGGRNAMYPKPHNSFHPQSDNLLLIFWQLKDLCRRHCFCQHEVLCLCDCAMHVNALTCVSSLSRDRKSITDVPLGNEYS